MIWFDLLLINNDFLKHKQANIKEPVRSNFPKFMFVDFSKVYAAVTYHAKPFFNPSTRSPFFSTIFLVFCVRH